MPVLRAPEAPTHQRPGTRFTSLATPLRGAVESSVWKVEIDPGTPSTRHEVTREEVFVVLEGTARVTLGAETGLAAPGDAIVVPPHTPFSLENPGPGRFVAVCCLPVGGQARLPGAEPFTPPWAQ